MPTSPITPPRKGIWAATITPLTENFTPDIGRFIRVGRWQLERGCHGLAMLGTTGEANSIALADRLELIKASCQEFGGDRLIIGAGACALGDVVRLIETALAGGCNEALVLPPWFYPADDDGVFAFFSALMDRFRGSGLRVYLYHHPKAAGVAFSHDLIARLLDAYPEGIVGMKDSSGDWSNMAENLRRFPGFSVMPGSETFLLSGLQAGAVGCISASFNVLSKLGYEVWRAFEAGETAQAEAAQQRLSALRAALQTFPLVSANKVLLAQLLGDDEFARVAPPLTQLSTETIQKLCQTIDEAGYQPVAWPVLRTASPDRSGQCNSSQLSTARPSSHHSHILVSQDNELPTLCSGGRNYGLIAVTCWMRVCPGMSGAIAGSGNCC